MSVAVDVTSPEGRGDDAARRCQQNQLVVNLIAEVIKKGHRFFPVKDCSVWAKTKSLNATRASVVLPEYLIATLPEKPAAIDVYRTPGPWITTLPMDKAVLVVRRKLAKSAMLQSDRRLHGIPVWLNLKGLPPPGRRVPTSWGAHRIPLVLGQRNTFTLHVKTATPFE